MIPPLSLFGPVTAPSPGPLMSALFIILGGVGLFRFCLYTRRHRGRVPWPDVLIVMMTFALLIFMGVRWLLR